ncbi:hypothetical protein PFICI_10397 [Pestalotiopsis fici W106-1]|uniref:Uncharacterized protein n=1 Tax=Pestalotiopsis fici (strain W106-1 / CGMCC3.15140) TaxID=1229662 RepID=W3WWW1_PESFW|nr:uncharacterized protein PFICI_10397 [Pestalotiopsis fici W106-1]ETS78335.1 hypothetical protein PFICI_10397 [Pestalotiopsis fici W106-1]
MGIYGDEGVVEGTRAYLKTGVSDVVSCSDFDDTDPSAPAVASEKSRSSLGKKFVAQFEDEESQMDFYDQYVVCFPDVSVEQTVYELILPVEQLRAIYRHGLRGALRASNEEASCTARRRDLRHVFPIDKPKVCVLRFKILRTI